MRRTTSSLVLGLLIHTMTFAHKTFRTSHSRDPNLHILSEELTGTVARVVVALFASATIFVPIIISSLTTSHGARLALVVLSIASFVGIISFAAKPKISEVFMAGAAYVHRLREFPTWYGPWLLILTQLCCRCGRICVRHGKLRVGEYTQKSIYLAQADWQRETLCHL